MKKKKVYTVWHGRKPGVYLSWDDCEAQVKGFAGAKYAAFPNTESALKAFELGPGEFIGKKDSISGQNLMPFDSGGPDPNSICVDAACSGNPGAMEYRGVFTETGSEIFRQGPYQEATNNIGEFLAIVHALAWMKQKHIELPVYSDSTNAILWVKKKKVNTKLEPTPRNQAVFNLIDRALKWLNENSYNNPVLKWETSAWGEIPADFGRK